MLKKGLICFISTLLLLVLILVYTNYKQRKNEIWIVICRTKLHSIANSFTYYCEHNKKWPPDKQWCDVLIKETDLHKDELNCPCAFNSKCNFAINEYVWGKDLDKENPDVVLIFESIDGWNNVGNKDMLETKNHNPLGANVMFVSGRIEFVMADKIKELSWQ